MSEKFEVPEPPEGKACMHQWATETTTFGKTYCVRCGKVGRDPLAPSAEAATPEPKKERKRSCADRRCSLCNAGIRHSSCTACPCARCLAEREFVRALAEVFGSRGSIGTANAFKVYAHNYGPVAAAARRVTEGR